VLVYFKKLRDERTALSRLNDILGSETRNVIARHNFIEAVRTTKDRVVSPEALAMSAAMSTHTKDAAPQGLPPITKGRVMLEEEIFKSAESKVKEYGVRLLDVRFKRIDYDASVSASIFQRMMTERQKIAEMHRSEGAGQAAEILGERERDLAEIESEAYRRVQEVEGAADAKATSHYQWFRLRAPIEGDQLLHRALLSFASDMGLLSSAMLPHGLHWVTPGLFSTSLDHAMWFHNDVQVDQWFVYVMDSDWTGGSRGINHGWIYSEDGTLVASVVQEGLLRLTPPA
jgi:acyl-CoA thioesterase